MDIRVDVIGQELRVPENFEHMIIEGTQQFVRFVFNLDVDWASLRIFAQFIQAGRAYNVYLDNNNSVALPAEIVKGTCIMILYGTGNTVKATTTYLKLTIGENKMIQNASSTEISQSLYDQLVDIVDNNKKETDDNFEELSAFVTAAISTPLKALHASDMTDHNKIYVYIGSESGYQYGYWYFWDTENSVWAPGLPYQSTGVAVDTTLTLPDVAAEGKAAGDLIRANKAAIDELSETKANIDGYYQEMTVGDAEQLVATQYVEDDDPYLFRTTGGSADVSNRAYLDDIIGGSLAWNQLVGTNSSVTIPDGHKYLSKIGSSWSIGSSIGNAISVTPNSDMMIDLTQMLGTTIADYIYSLEQATAGAGVAWFKKYFPNDKYPYNAGEMIHVSGLQSHDAVGFNQWDEEWEVGNIDSTTGINLTATDRIRSKNYTKVIPSTYYYCHNIAWLYEYDSEKNYLGRVNVGNNAIYLYQTKSNTCYIRFVQSVSYGTAYNHDICINLSWSGTRNGEYEPYQKHSYALDDSLTLSGIPKIDANGNLYYNGDEYSYDGAVTRKYGIVDLGSLNWGYDNSRFWIQLPSAVTVVANMNFLCSKYTVGSVYSNDDKTIYRGNHYVTNQFNVNDSAYTDAATFKSAMSGVMLVYELAAPTTETAEPYNEVQIVDDWGTEEFVTTSIVPVMHHTRYPANLRDKLQHLPDLAENDGDYIIRQSNTQMELIPVSEAPVIEEIGTRAPKAPSATGSYILKATVTPEGTSYVWKDLTDEIPIVRYGVDFESGVNSGLTVKRTYNAVGLTAGVSTDTVAATNDFDNIYPWSAIKTVCGDWNGDNFVINAYKGDPDFATDGSNGDVWVEIPKFYFKHGYYGGNSEQMIISPTPLDGYSVSPVHRHGNEKYYIPAYMMDHDSDNNIPRSRSGVFSGLYSLDSGMTEARKKGSDFVITQAAEIYTLLLLMTVEFGTRNLQSVMAGATSLSYAASDTAVEAGTNVNYIVVAPNTASKYVVGQTIGIGTSLGSTGIANNRLVTSIEDSGSNKKIVFDGAPVNIAVGNIVFTLGWINGACDGVLGSSGSPISNTNGKYQCMYRGIENPYGNVFCTVSDVLFKRTGEEGSYEYEAYYLPDPTLYSNGAITDDYVRLSYNLPATDGYVSKLGLDERYPFIRVPSAVGAGSNTYYSDYYYYPRAAITAGRVGGYWCSGSPAGLSDWYCPYAPSPSDISCRARLSKHRQGWGLGAA